MANIESLAQEIKEIRQAVEILEDKINQILAVMETFAELQDAEYDDDDEDDFESNEGWIGGDVEWFRVDNEEDEDD